MRAALISIASLALFACPEPYRPDPPEDPDSGITGDPLWPDGTVELGTPMADEVTWQSMPAELELHAGAQGGFHVPVLYRVTGKVQPGVTFDHRVRRTRDGVLVSRGSRQWDITATDGGSWTTDYPVTIFMCPTPVGVNVEGEALTIEVTLTRASGTFLGRATAKTVLRCPSANQAFCQSICKG